MNKYRFSVNIFCLMLALASVLGTLGCASETDAAAEPDSAEMEKIVYEYDGVEYPAEATADNFLLLYNTLGYEKTATKKAFVRSLDYVSPEKVSDESFWQLKAENGDIAAEGKLIYRGISFGLQLWEAEFSDFDTEGTYILNAKIANADGTFVYEEKSEAFLLQKSLYVNNILLPLTLYNAQMREAPANMAGGYYDCNNPMGEAYSHGVFLNGLVQTYVYREDALTDAEKEGLEEAAAIAFDYLVNLHVEKTGEIRHSPAIRPGADLNLGSHNTFEGLYGFAAYLYHFKDIDPDRASQENFERAVKSAEYLESLFPNGGSALYPNKEFLTPVYYYLYKYSGDETFLDKGIALMEDTLRFLDLRSISRHGGSPIPLLEGVYLIMKECPDHPSYETWMKYLMQIKNAYYTNLSDKNAFVIFPISEQDMSMYEWDEMWLMPTAWQINTRRATNALDACFISELTGDYSLEEIAAGELGYIMGLNAGFKGKYVEDPYSDNKMAAGSFIHNLNARHVTAWQIWGFKLKDNGWMSIMNGYTMEDGDYYYRNQSSNDWYTGETFIRHDGAFAYAFCVYENYLNMISE